MKTGIIGAGHMPTPREGVRPMELQCLRPVLHLHGLVRSGATVCGSIRGSV
jgi:hypothetical protein